MIKKHYMFDETKDGETRYQRTIDAWIDDRMVFGLKGKRDGSRLNIANPGIHEHLWSSHPIRSWSCVKATNSLTQF
jgi:hypothetical protein